MQVELGKGVVCLLDDIDRAILGALGKSECRRIQGIDDLVEIGLGDAQVLVRLCLGGAGIGKIVSPERDRVTILIIRDQEMLFVFDNGSAEQTAPLPYFIFTGKVIAVDVFGSSQGVGAIIAPGRAGQGVG